MKLHRNVRTQGRPEEIFKGGDANRLNAKVIDFFFCIFPTKLD